MKRISTIRLWWDDPEATWWEPLRWPYDMLHERLHRRCVERQMTMVERFAGPAVKELVRIQQVLTKRGYKLSGDLASDVELAMTVETKQYTVAMIRFEFERFLRNGIEE